MNPFRIFLALVLAGSLASLYGQSTPSSNNPADVKLPIVVTSGFDAYAQDGAERAVNRWLGSSMNDKVWDTRKQLLAGLSRAEANYGAYTNYEYLRKVILVTKTTYTNTNIVQTVQTGYGLQVKVLYENGVVIMQFNFDLQNDRLMDFKIVDDLNGRPGGLTRGAESPYSPIRPAGSPMASGFAAYASQGAAAAAAVWLKGSTAEGAIADTTQLLTEAESVGGKYVSFTPLPPLPPRNTRESFSIGTADASPSKALYAIVYYEKQPLYLSFALSADNQIQSVQGDITASKIIPDATAASRAEQAATDHYQASTAGPPDSSTPAPP